MPANHAAENVLGTIGTVMWSGQIIPQIWKSWRAHSTEGLSGLLMWTWATSAIFLGVYNIVQDINIPLIIQPQLFGLFASISWAQCMYYGSKKSVWFCAVSLAAYLVIFAGFETGMTFACRAVTRHSEGTGERLTRFFGVFSAVLISLGLVPQYIEIYQKGEVIGISLIFISIDISGAVFSLLSLILRDDFDVFAAVSYIAVIVLDGVVVVCAMILNPRKERARRQERRQEEIASGMVGTAIGPAMAPHASDVLEQIKMQRPLRGALVGRYSSSSSPTPPEAAHRLSNVSKTETNASTLLELTTVPAGRSSKPERDVEKGTVVGVEDSKEDENRERSGQGQDEKEEVIDLEKGTIHI